MSEGFQEFLKWIVIGVVIISVYNLVTEKKLDNTSNKNISSTKTSRVIIVIGDQASATFHHW